MRLRWVGPAWLACALLGTMKAQQPGWTVRPEWVRAHEEFLAGDALAGRGSATRDEQIAAEYVASEFRGYGLQTPPGMKTYLQSAAVISPVLDGAGTLTVAGGKTFQEGSDFQLLMSSGQPLRGALKKVAAAETGKAEVRGTVVLVQGDARTAVAAARTLIGRGAAAVLVEKSDASDAMLTMFGGKTRVPIRLEESSPRPGRTMVVLSSAAMEELAALSDGAVIDLTVRAVPQARTRETFNAVGYLPGTDPASGTILLTAHLDHLGVGKPVNGDAIFNGANDDAAGTTAVLELAHALGAGPRLRRSVLFVCYGSEEAGVLGSTYFGEHPPVPLGSLVANLEFEMIGNQDPKMPPGVLLLTGWERSNLGPMLKQHGASVGPDPYPEQHFFERSDNYALALKGVVAHTAAGWGTVPTYHQPSDDLAHLDLAFMTAAIQSLVEPVRWLAMSDFKPEWTAGGRPQAPTPR